jgi:hypothetical protein
MAPSSGWAGGAQASLMLAWRLQLYKDRSGRCRDRALSLSRVLAARSRAAGLVLALEWAAAVGDVAPSGLKRGLCTSA